MQKDYIYFKSQIYQVRTTFIPLHYICTIYIKLYHKYPTNLIQPILNIEYIIISGKPSSSPIHSPHDLNNLYPKPHSTLILLSTGPKPIAIL